MARTLSERTLLTLRGEYEAGEEPLTRLAERHGTSPKTIGKYAEKYGWDRSRRAPGGKARQGTAMARRVARALAEADGVLESLEADAAQGEPLSTKERVAQLANLAQTLARLVALEKETKNGALETEEASHCGVLLVPARVSPEAWAETAARYHRSCLYPRAQEHAAGEAEAEAAGEGGA